MPEWIRNIQKTEKEDAGVKVYREQVERRMPEGVRKRRREERECRCLETLGVGNVQDSWWRRGAVLANNIIITYSNNQAATR